VCNSFRNFRLEKVLPLRFRGPSMFLFVTIVLLSNTCVSSFLNTRMTRRGLIPCRGFVLSNRLHSTFERGSQLYRHMSIMVEDSSNQREKGSAAISSQTFLGRVMDRIRTWRYLVYVVITCVVNICSSKIALAATAISASSSIAATSSKETFLGKMTPVQGFLVWVTLFLLSATLHSAEAAMTKISPWRVAQVAEEEGKGSPFVTLSENLTQLLSTILVTTTTLSIYSTAFFVTIMSSTFPSLSLGFITALLTIFTLFFGELLPKAIAVSNSELVARKTVKSISRLATVLYPITFFFKCSSDYLLRFAGLRSIEDNSVSEDMLRMVVNEAVKTEGDGIEGREGRMIKNVLDMQETSVSRIMRPRIDIDACSESCSLAELLELVLESKYSRIPVYRGDVDNIVGVVFSKDLLDFVKLKMDDRESLARGSLQRHSDGNVESVSTALTPTGEQFSLALNSTDIISPTYFIPETMSTWNALEEMRNRRVHMAIVVDEYGGTSGLVTFEDILEEVVGEIYDEDDDQEDVNEDATIFLKEEGVFEIKGHAELDDVYEALGMSEQELEIINADTSGDYSTIGGLVCSEAGEIPEEGFEFMLGRYDFNVLDVEGDRRILLLRAVKARTDEDEDMEDNISASSGLNSGADATDAAVDDHNGSSNRTNGDDSKKGGSDGSGNNNSNNAEASSVDSGNENSVDGESGGGKVFRDGEWVEAENPPSSLLED
jgi:putative hemolysin